MKKTISAAFASVVLAFGFTLGGASTPAQAMSGISTLPAQTSDFESSVIKVQRRRRGRRGRRIRNGVAIGIGAAILGGIIASEANRRRYYDDPPRVYHRPRSSLRARKRRCARNFRSFDWPSGTIITRRGHEVLCPYLR